MEKKIQAALLIAALVSFAVGMLSMFAGALILGAEEMGESQVIGAIFIGGWFVATWLGITGMVYQEAYIKKDAKTKSNRLIYWQAFKSFIWASCGFLGFWALMFWAIYWTVHHPDTLMSGMYYFSIVGSILILVAFVVGLPLLVRWIWRHREDD